MKKLTFILLVAAGLLCACTQSANEKDDTLLQEKAARELIKTFAMTPDSLRPADQVKMFKLMEYTFYKYSKIKNNRIVITIDKNTWCNKGMSAIYYQIMQKDIEDMNTMLTKENAAASKRLLDAFIATQKKYFANLKEIPK